MGERKWTEAQLSAIEYGGKNLLVSAAAGSGKTATLTERIIRLITEQGADVTRMLIVTFTKAAATELRERVTSALGDAFAKDPENGHLRDQICRIGDAMICTMDSFFLSCVKPMFADVGLPSDFRIGDKAELDSLRADAMEETVDCFFDSGDPEKEMRITAVAEAIGSARSEDGIDSILLEFEAEADRVGIGEKELFEYARELVRYSDSDILETPFCSCITEELLSGFEYYGNIAETLAPVMAENEELIKKYVPAAYSMAEYCRNCTDAIKSGDVARLRLLLQMPPFEKISTKSHTDESELFIGKRNEFKKFIKEMYGGYLSHEPAVIRDVMLKTSEICSAAGEIIGEFEKRFTELKRRRGVTDYSDVAKMASRLLADDNGVPTPYGETVASRYDYVFIDEYQDTSIYQDRIFAAVASKCGRFMVGDIKQSIYRFRGGEPEVFKGYREAWSDSDGCKTVFMSENFRCADPVVRFVNCVSKYMFPYGRINFEKGDLLIHGREEKEGAEFSPVEVCLIERPNNTKGDTGEETETVPPAALLEIEYIAERIRHMLDFEHLPDGTPVKPSDIAVMSRDLSSRRGVITEVFRRYGIPLNDMAPKPLLERPEIMLIMCVLSAVDNPTRDIPLAGAMRSGIFGFTLGDIAEIKHSLDGGNCSLWDGVKHMAQGDGELSLRCAEFIEKISEYRTLARTVSAGVFIYRLIHEPYVTDGIFSEGGVGAMDRAMEFYSLARGHGTGLYDFLSYVEYVKESGLDSRENGGGDGVSVITVHHSKGLEFPICFLMNATKKYSKNDAKKSMLLDRDFGVAMKLADEMGLVRCDNHLRQLAVFRGMKENSFEEMRVLYVAMTRARERLIITGVTSSPGDMLKDAFMNAKFHGEYSVGSKKTYMDMILEALNLYGGDFASVITVPYSTCDEITDDDGIFVDAERDNPEEDCTANDTMAVIEERIAFEYGYGHLRNIPSKLSVSKLYPEILDEYDDGATPVQAETVSEPAVPKFMRDSGYSPADSGSAAHVFLQFCDFEKLKNYGVGSELCRLVAEGFMSKAQGEAANLEYIEAFRQSEFFSRVLSAKEVRREFRFNAAIPASSFTVDAEKRALLQRDGTDVIAQGVIDIVFTDCDGRLILADYKTDRLSDYELKNKSAASKKLWDRHGNQLGYYAQVCEKLFGKAPDEVLIYSMPLGETV